MKILKRKKIEIEINIIEGLYVIKFGYIQMIQEKNENIIEFATRVGFFILSATF